MIFTFIELVKREFRLPFKVNVGAFATSVLIAEFNTFFKCQRYGVVTFFSRLLPWV